MREKRKIERLGRKAITAFTKRLTDEIFLFIERDPALLKEYKEAVKTYSAHSVNATLGKMIAEAYGLGNLQKESNPDSALLKRVEESLEKYEKKLRVLQKEESMQFELRGALHLLGALKEEGLGDERLQKIEDIIHKVMGDA